MLSWPLPEQDHERPEYATGETSRAVEREIEISGVRESE
jgi:hypothetical protein